MDCYTSNFCLLKATGWSWQWGILKHFDEDRTSLGYVINFYDFITILLIIFNLFLYILIKAVQKSKYNIYPEYQGFSGTNYTQYQSNTDQFPSYLPKLWHHEPPINTILSYHFVSFYHPLHKTTVWILQSFEILGGTTKTCYFSGSWC